MYIITLILLLNRLIFVVIFVIGAGALLICYKLKILVLVHINFANVLLILFIIVVIFTAFAIICHI